MMKKFKHLSAGFLGAIFLAIVSSSARADTVIIVTNESSQGATDSINWSQLGGDATVLKNASFPVNTAKSNAVTATLKGADSLTAVVCPAAPCRKYPRLNRPD